MAQHSDREERSESGGAGRASKRPYIVFIIGLIIFGIAAAVVLWDNNRMACEAPGAVTPQSWTEWEAPSDSQSE